MSKLRYTTTERDALARVATAFRVRQLPEDASALASLLEALAQSRRSDRFETRTDSEETRPMLHLLAAVLRAPSDLDKLPILASAIEAMKLPRPEVEGFWDRKKRPVINSALTEILSSKSDFAELPSLKHEFDMMRLWLEARNDPDHWSTLASWQRIVFNRIQTNVFIPPNIKAALARDEPTDADYTLVSEYVAEGEHGGLGPGG